MLKREKGEKLTTARMVPEIARLEGMKGIYKLRSPEVRHHPDGRSLCQVGGHDPPFALDLSLEPTLGAEVQAAPPSCPADSVPPQLGHLLGPRARPARSLDLGSVHYLKFKIARSGQV